MFNRYSAPMAGDRSLIAYRTAHCSAVSFAGADGTSCVFVNLICHCRQSHYRKVFRRAYDMTATICIVAIRVADVSSPPAFFGPWECRNGLFWGKLIVVHLLCIEFCSRSDKDCFVELLVDSFGCIFI